jgi:6-phosphogluconolactonase
MFPAIKYRNGIIALSILFSSCSKEVMKSEDAMTPDVSAQSRKANPRAGFVYTMSNEASGNQILGYHQSPDGKLMYRTTTASGGNGTDAGLGSQGSIVIDEAHEWLFAVNAGSNSISSFQIREDGSLMLAHTAASNGTRPVSVTVHGTFLYVVNSISSNISGYRVGTGGTLMPIEGSVKPLSTANAGPAQISFTPDGHKLIVTEKNTNMITSYSVDNAGTASSATSVGSAGQTPFGFDFAGNGTIVVTEASGGAMKASTVSAYSVWGNTTLTGGPVANNQTAACWAAVTQDGRYAYVTNTGSKSISSFEVTATGKLKLLNAVEATTGTTPTDIVLSGNDFYIYNLNAGSHSITAYKKGGNETLKQINEITGLPAHAVGLASF